MEIAFQVLVELYPVPWLRLSWQSSLLVLLHHLEDGYGCLSGKWSHLEECWETHTSILSSPIQDILMTSIDNCFCTPFGGYKLNEDGCKKGTHATPYYIPSRWQSMISHSLTVPNMVDLYWLVHSTTALGTDKANYSTGCQWPQNIFNDKPTSGCCFDITLTSLWCPNIIFYKYAKRHFSV